MIKFRLNQTERVETEVREVLADTRGLKPSTEIRHMKTEYTRPERPEAIRKNYESKDYSTREKGHDSRSPNLNLNRSTRLNHQHEENDHSKTEDGPFSTFQQKDYSRTKVSDLQVRDRRANISENTEGRSERLNRSQNTVVKEIIETRTSNLGHSLRQPTEVIRTKKIETVETKLVKDLEIRLISAFKCIIDVEKAVESSKQELSLRPDYSIKDHFKMMDSQDKGGINYNEFGNFIKRTKLPLDNLPVLSKLFEEADSDRDGLISQVEFQDLVSPKQKEYKILLNCRVERGAGCNYDYDKVARPH
jgi:hypothetical protein